MKKYQTPVKTISDNREQAAEEFNAIKSLLVPYLQKVRQDQYKLESNQIKNRPCGIYPYDHTMVTSNEVDYINASWIRVLMSPLPCIAAQAPLEHTVGDFFNVMIENRCDRLVTLVMGKEPKKSLNQEIEWVERCFEYWEREIDLGNGYCLLPGKEVGKLSCNNTKEEVILRELHITKDGNPFKVILQYHYKNWPDHGDPNILLYDAFMKLVIDDISARRDKTLMGHCHAGSGRTGIFFATLFAVDYIQQQLAEGKKIEEIEINIPQMVYEMKTCRQMLNNESQYLFVRSWLTRYVNTQV